jgi:hypothetical protein
MKTADGKRLQLKLVLSQLQQVYTSVYGRWARGTGIDCCSYSSDPSEWLETVHIFNLSMSTTPQSRKESPQ